jgi:hypothetical protein
LIEIGIPCSGPAIDAATALVVHGTGSCAGTRFVDENEGVGARAVIGDCGEAQVDEVDGARGCRSGHNPRS